jgi:hypothetical protein
LPAEEKAWKAVKHEIRAASQDGHSNLNNQKVTGSLSIGHRRKTGTSPKNLTASGWAPLWRFVGDKLSPKYRYSRSPPFNTVTSKVR